ncbi:MAG: CCA tRNA nucleotidyltransferase [Pseudomonadota bacterium]
MDTFALSPPWLSDNGLRAVLTLLTARGEARVIGGAVRNTLLSQPVSDFDIATTLTPDAVKAAARAAGIAAHDTGIAHGTLTLVSAGTPYEVTTLRRDVTTDGRRATVAFTTDWDEDAQRRDFTMNALSLDPSGKGYDYVGGYRDCLSREVRFIGDPVRRIREDHLRILRYFRFHAAYGRGEMDDEALRAIVAERDLVARLPAERVFHELTRLLAAPRAIDALRVMARNDVIAAFLPVPMDVDGAQQLNAAARTLGEDAPSALSYLALMGYSDTHLSALAGRLKFPRKLTQRALAALTLSQAMPPSSDRAARLLLYDHGREAFCDGLMVALARGLSLGDHAALKSLAERFAPPVFPVSGRDLLEAGASPGPQLGEELHKLKKAWRDSDFALTREALLALSARTAGKT